MPASNRYRNWTDVSLGAVSITGIKSISLDHGVQDIQEGADADMGPTHGVVVFQNPKFNIQTIDAMALISMTAGVKGVFTATLNDSYNGTTASGGARSFTTNAYSYIGGRTQEGAYNALANGTIMIHTVWSDGTTNPISVAAL